MPNTTEKTATFNGWKAEVVIWLRQQAISTVFAVILLGIMTWGGYYALTWAVPSHLSMIQSGYERLANDYKEDLRNQREQFDDVMERTTETFKESLTEQRETNTILRELVRETRKGQ